MSYMLAVYILGGPTLLGIQYSPNTVMMPLDVCVEMAEKLNRPDLFPHPYQYKAECLREDVARSRYNSSR